MPSNIKTGIFKGKSGIKGRLKWWVGISEDDDITTGTWLTPNEAKKLASKILKLCNKLELSLKREKRQISK